MFNVKGQVNKQICAVAVIIAQFYCATIALVHDHEANLSFAMVVLAYSMICLFSFLNLIYVRDFDCLQVNFTPLALSVAGIIQIISGSNSIAMYGLTVSLAADSYFALRFKEGEDKI
jgi:hypothetical protein